ERRRVRDDVLTWANLVTLIRLLGLPVFVWLALVAQDGVAATVVLVLIAGTDWVDGYLARRLDQVSRLGMTLDPIADRLLITTVVVTLAASTVTSWWFLAAILVPDTAQAVVALIKYGGNPRLPVTVVGKVRTALLLAGLPLLLLATALGWPDWVRISAYVIVIAGFVGHWIAASQYLRIMLKHQRRVAPAHPGSGTAPKN
ncbi:MAG: CDP-alcohol phosphatidyltransferase family protein, partial [Cellulomonadaceae bacterium]